MTQEEAIGRDKKLGKTIDHDGHDEKQERKVLPRRALRKAKENPSFH
ncbi:MAG: hypothetical protein LBI87_09155 [Candidatus Accumulibacter sp.]|nr:hypothetical protein [Accumulibacter sp.]